MNICGWSGSVLWPGECLCTTSRRVVSADGFASMSAYNLFSQHSTRTNRSHDWQAGPVLGPAGSVRDVVRGRCPSGSGGVLRDAPLQPRLKQPCSFNGRTLSHQIALTAGAVVLAVTPLRGSLLDQLCHPPTLSRFRGAVGGIGPQDSTSKVGRDGAESRRRAE